MYFHFEKVEEHGLFFEEVKRMADNVRNIRSDEDLEWNSHSILGFSSRFEAASLQNLQQALCSQESANEQEGQTMSVGYVFLHDIEQENSCFLNDMCLN